VDEEDIKAIITHGYEITTDEAEPTSNLEKSLFAVDELTGIIQAYALMRPEKMEGMAVKSLKKKYKDKRFAAKCNREIIDKGVEKLGMELSEVMNYCIKGMTEHSDEIGL
jgi:predicted hydrolase (HD superfamily)